MTKLDAAVVGVDGDRDGLLGLVLANDVLVEVGLHHAGGGEVTVEDSRDDVAVLAPAATGLTAVGHVQV